MYLRKRTLATTKWLLIWPALFTTAFLFAQTTGTVRLKNRFPPPPVQINEKNWPRLWKTLAGSDPEDARAVMHNLMLYPEDSTPFLQKSIPVVPPPNTNKLQTLLENLDHPRYPVRVSAHQQLQNMGMAAKGALLQTQQTTTSAEVRRRTALLLRRLRNRALMPDELRLWRALNVVEHLGTKGARQHLQVLTKGAKGHWLTEAATASLVRLKQREKHIKLVDAITPGPSLTGHTSTVMSLAIDPTGRWLASGSYDRTVRLWDLQTGRTIKVLQGHTTNVYVVAFSADGKKLISSDSSRVLKFWDVKQAKVIASVTTGHRSYVRSLAVSPDGKYVATGCSGIVKLWDVKQHKCVATLQGNSGYIYGLAFSPDGRRLASSGSSRVVQVWNVATRQVEKEIRFPTTYPRSLVFTPDGGTLIFGMGQLVKVWELGSNQEMSKFTGHTGSIYTVALHPDGRTVVSVASDRTVRLWDRFTGRSLATLTTGASTVRTMVLSPDGRYLVSHGPGASTALRVWEFGPKK